MKKTIVIVILFFFLLQVFIYRSILFQESISHYADWYFPVTKDGVIKRASYFYTWDDWSYEGTNRVLKLPGTPFWIPLGLLSYMGIEPWILFRLCLIVIGVLASVGIFLLCKRFGLNSFGCVMGSLFYVFSPWFFAYAVWGWVYILVGYALLPFAFLFYLKALETQNMVYAICTSILSAGIGLQTHNLAIVFLLFLFYAIFDSLISANRKIFGNLKMLVLVAVLVLLLHSYWIAPFIGQNITSQRNMYEIPILQFDLNWRTSGLKLFSTIRVIGSPGNFYLVNISFSQNPVWLFLTFLLPITAFLPLLLRPRDKNVLFFAIASLIFILLSTGTNPPMNGAYLWLFQHIPFFDAFRDPSKWLFMVSFAYSCLLGYAANSINHIKKTSLATAKKIWTKKNFKRILSTSLVVVTLTTYALPYLNNDYAKALRATTYPESYYEVDKWLAEQENNFKVTWLPTDTGIKYTWAPYPCRDPFAFFGSKSTFELGNKQFSRWLTMNMYLNSTEYLGKLLGIANVKYLIIPDDRQSNTLMFYVKAFPFYKERLLQTLHAQKGLNPILQIDDTEIRENTFFQENIRTTNNYLVDMNSDLTDLIYLTYIGDETSNIFTKTAVLFLSQIQENISDYINKSKYILNPQNLDYQLATLNDEKITIINVGEYVNPKEDLLSENFRDWTNNIIHWWYSQKYSSILETVAFTIKANATLSIPFTIRETGKYNLLAKICYIAPETEVSIHIDNNKISEITNVKESSWINLKTIPLTEGKHQLIIQNNKDAEAAIAKIVFVPEHLNLDTEIPIKENQRIIYAINNDKLSVNPDNLIMNSSFENEILDWELSKKEFTYERDSTTCTDGKYSLKVTTNTTNKVWSWIQSSSINVTSESKYVITTYMKYENVNQSHIVIEGYNKTSEKWIQLRQIPCGKTGSSDWQKFEYTLEIPNNITQVRIVLNAGWVLDASKGSAITWFDDIKITACNQQSDKMGAANGDLLQLLPSIEASKQLQIIKSSKYKIAIRTFSSLNSGPILIEIGNNKFEINIASNEPKFEIFYTPAFFINKGTYDLSISSNGNSLLDVIYIFSVEKENETLEDIFKSEENPANIITYQKINPTKYTAKINATKPFMLSFAEAYDPLWVCYANGEKISSIPLYGAINGFWINQTGTLEITIEYEPQKWFQTGTTISATTFITCTAYLTYTRTKQKRLTKNKKPKT